MKRMYETTWIIGVLWLALALGLTACQPVRPVTPTPAAATTTVAASEPATSPVEFVLSITGDPNPLSRPTSLALGQQGRLYVVDSLNNRIQVFDAAGRFLTLWGSKGNDDGQFNLSDEGGDGYGSVTVDGQGNVYITDTFNQRIQKFTSDGQFLTKWGSNGTGDGQFLRPFDVAVDKQGQVYVIDDHRGDIQKFDSTGQFLTK
jgi:DNA-binding beta-propeller fold protein YncE